MGKINLFGASGHAKVIKDIIEAQGDEVLCLFDDNPHCDNIHGCPVFKASGANVSGPMIISIGSNKVRKLISQRYLVDYAKAIHPTAMVSHSATIGSGSVVMHGAIIQSDACIGKHCIINSGASIDHECEIADYVHISPHATLCGNVHIGEGAWIGAGATIVPGINIGKWCTIGAGSVVVDDIPDGCLAYGNPCKLIKTVNEDMLKSVNPTFFFGGG